MWTLPTKGENKDVVYKMRVEGGLYSAQGLGKTCSLRIVRNLWNISKKSWNEKMH